MKKLLVLIALISSVLLSLFGCGQTDKYNHEQFYGVVRFSEELGGEILYIPEYGELEIPEHEGCCTCFDGHEPNEDYSYRLKAGDLVKINFKYESSYDDRGVQIMESHPARFDRKAGLIEVKRQNIFLDKVDSGYVISFPSSTELEDLEVGESLYFIRHGGYDGRAYQSLYATANVTSRTGQSITAKLNFCENEADFLMYFCNGMTVERSWEY